MNLAHTLADLGRGQAKPKSRTGSVKVRGSVQTAELWAPLADGFGSMVGRGQGQEVSF